MLICLSVCMPVSAHAYLTHALLCAQILVFESFQLKSSGELQLFSLFALVDHVFQNKTNSAFLLQNLNPDLKIWI